MFAGIFIYFEYSFLFTLNIFRVSTVDHLQEDISGIPRQLVQTEIRSNQPIVSCKTETAKNVIKFIGMYLERSPFRENWKPSCQKMHCKGHHHCFFPWRHFCEFYKRHCFISQTYPFADVIQNRWSWKFCEIQKKTPLLESLVTQHVGSTQNFENFL